MDVKDIKTIGIVGAGTMGSGIARVVVESGFDVLIYDNNPVAIQNSVEHLKKYWRRSISDEYVSEYLTEDVFEPMISRRLNVLMDRLKITDSLKGFKYVDFVIEAVAENLKIKQDIFRSLDSICRFEVVFVSNTSSIPIGEIAWATGRQRKVAGMHFMNPPHLVKLVELICSDLTSWWTIDLVRKLSRRLNRNPIIESADKPGFICNFILMSAINEAAKAVEEGRGTIDNVNKSIVMGVGGTKGMPILELADLIGLDICVNILKTMKRKPCVLLRKMVADGLLGRKSKKGFFDYTKNK